MAFHSPIMKVIRAEMSEFIDSLEFHPPSIPVISNTTQEPFPDDPEQIKRIVMAHLEAPVHWMQNVRTLAEDFGVGLFVEVGPKDSISNLVADTIDGAEVLHTCHPDDETGVFRTAAARLWCLGHLEAPGHLEQVSLKPGRSKQEMTRQVLQREINAFVQQNLDGSLAQALLRAVQDEVDPNLSGDELGRLLGGGLSLNLPPAAALTARRTPAIPRKATSWSGSSSCSWRPPATNATRSSRICSSVTTWPSAPAACR